MAFPLNDDALSAFLLRVDQSAERRTGDTLSDPSGGLIIMEGGKVRERVRAVVARSGGEDR